MDQQIRDAFYGSEGEIDELVLEIERHLHREQNEWVDKLFEELGSTYYDETRHHLGVVLTLLMATHNTPFDLPGRAKLVEKLIEGTDKEGLFLEGVGHTT